VTQHRRDWTSFDARRLGAGVVALLMLLMAAMPASAQFSQSYKFLEAIRKANQEDIVKFLEQPGVTLVNTRDSSTGETALLITVGRRDVIYTNYLLSRSANPNLTNNAGLSPLMLAVERRFTEGAPLLLANGANPNLTNDSGETPLIRAVQMRDLEMARLLVAKGGDPNRKDRLAGMSALDYARAGNTTPGMIELLTANAAAPRAPNVQGPHL